MITDADHFVCVSVGYWWVCTARWRRGSHLMDLPTHGAIWGVYERRQHTCGHNTWCSRATPAPWNTCWVRCEGEHSTGWLVYRALCSCGLCCRFLGAPGQLQGDATLQLGPCLCWFVQIYLQTPANGTTTWHRAIRTHTRRLGVCYTKAATGKRRQPLNSTEVWRTSWYPSGYFVLVLLLVLVLVVVSWG